MAKSKAITIPNLSAKDFSQLLDDLGACSDACEFTKGKSLAVAWRTSKRGDWMLWLVGKMADKPSWPTRKYVVLAACDCAETALKYVKDGEDRPRIAIETARAWVRGEASIEDVRRAASAAYAAYAADAGDAAYAAYATSAASAASAAYAADAGDAAYAAYAAAYAAYAAASAASRTKALAACATIVRERIKVATK